MDYLEFFDLAEDPYRLTPDPFFFYPSQEHNEILSSLNYAVEQKEGFFLATGEPGTGKTTILKVFIDKWKERAEIALIMTPRLSPEQFLLALLEDLKIPVTTDNKNEILKSFRNFLVEHSSGRMQDDPFLPLQYSRDPMVEHSSPGKRVIIIVDEAQNLPDETLEELRLLSNLETEKEKLLQIILIGQPELRTRLLSNEMRQLNQRITIRATLKPLSMNETADYINYRLIKAGKGSVFFEEKAKRLLYKTSKGIPRLINLIASRAMMAAYLDTSRHVRKRHVVYATRHLLDETLQHRRWPAFLSKPVIAVLLVALGMLAALVVFGNFNLHMPSVEFKSAVFPKPLKEEMPVKVEIDTSSQTSAQKPDQKPELINPSPKRIIVTAEDVNLRAAPSLDSDSVALAARGNSFDVAGESADASGRKWYKVKTAEGRECWIAADAVKTITN